MSLIVQKFPARNGQGRTKAEAQANLAEAIGLILEDRRQDALQSLPPDAERDIVTVQ